MNSAKDMNYGESSGKSSSGTRENGAVRSDFTDRPHKKARFPWQIKGKHHLKNQTDQRTESAAFAPTEPEPKTLSHETDAPLLSQLIATDSTCSATLKNEAMKNSINNAKRILRQSSIIDWDPPLPFETVISLAEAMLLQSENDCSNSPVNKSQNTYEQDSMTGPSAPVMTAREARRLRKAEDKCISEWQATQNVKGCFDNTINRVLESWNHDASPEDRLLTLDFIRVMNQLPQNDDNVENVGIMMAINAHGLQNVVPAAFPNIWTKTIASDIPIFEDSDSSICSEDLELTYGRGVGSQWPSNELDTQNEDASQPRPYPNFDRKQAAMVEDYNEYEFMNTAVIQAIKSKGLMAAGTDFG